MLIIPAIDIQEGNVVRFTQGARDKKIYSRDPLKTAKHWVRQGARLIHIVDLDAAFSGELKNLNIVKKIAETVDVPLEFGGGVRSERIIKQLLDLGLRRVVLGTKALDEAFLKKAFEKFKDRVIVSIDVKSEKILTKGWKQAHARSNVPEFACKLKKLGFKEMIYTDVSKDGTLQGPSIKDIKKLLKDTGIKIIASGGVSSLDDIRRLKLLEKDGLAGVIIGKALYEGKFTLSEAIKIS